MRSSQPRQVVTILRNYNNSSPPQQLTMDITNSQTTIPVPSTVGYPTPPFVLGLDRGITGFQEVCLCTAIGSSTSFTVIRGWNGTTAVAHTTGATVEHTSAAADFSEPNTYINLQAAIGDLVAMASGGPGVVSLPTGTSQFPNWPDGYALVADHTSPTGVSWQQIIPTGVSMEYRAGTTAPAGFLLEDGSAVSRTTYAALFAKIGTTYGVGDGVTTFNVPDSRGLVSIGYKSGDPTFGTLGATGGHVSLTLVTNNIPQFTIAPSVSEPNSGQGHRHGTNASGNTSFQALYTATSVSPQWVPGDNSGVTPPVTITSVNNRNPIYITYNSGNVGAYQTSGITVNPVTIGQSSPTALNILPPYMVVTKIIKY